MRFGVSFGRSLGSFIFVLIVLYLFAGVLTSSLYHADSERFDGATAANVNSELGEFFLFGKGLDSVLATLWIAFLGFGFGCMLTVLFSIPGGLFPSFVEVFFPVINTFRSIPLTALVPFLIILPNLSGNSPWKEGASVGQDPVYLIAAGCFLYLVTGFAEGVAGRDFEREKVFRFVHRYSRWRYFWSVLQYEVRPSVLTSMRLALLFSLVLAVVLEQLVLYPGAGYEIQKAFAGSHRGSTVEAGAIALLVVIAAVGLIIDALFRAGRWCSLRWWQREH